MSATKFFKFDNMSMKFNSEFIEITQDNVSNIVKLQDLESVEFSSKLNYMLSFGKIVLRVNTNTKLYCGEISRKSVIFLKKQDVVMMDNLKEICLLIERCGVLVVLKKGNLLLSVISIIFILISIFLIFFTFIFALQNAVIVIFAILVFLMQWIQILYNSWPSDYHASALSESKLCRYFSW